MFMWYVCVVEIKQDLSEKYQMNGVPCLFSYTFCHLYSLRHGYYMLINKIRISLNTSYQE